MIIHNLDRQTEETSKIQELEQFEEIHDLKKSTSIKR